MSKTHQAIIVDDEPTAREILAMHLSKVDSIRVIQECKNATEAFSAVNRQVVDLIFLDINMPEIDGLMFAKAIQGHPKIIFTTAYREYAVEGFDLQVIDYLVKPISLERLLKALQKFQGLSEPKLSEDTRVNFTFFRSDRKMVKVDFDNILYIESLGDYLKIHTLAEVIVTRETLSATLEKLPTSDFLRTHRSYIVAISKIESFTNEHITLHKKAIPISRGYRDSVLQSLSIL